MSNKKYDDEFEIGKGTKNNDDFSIGRSWQKGYGITRFSPQYIADCYSSDAQAVFKVISYGHGKAAAKNILEYVNYRNGEAQEFYTESGEILQGEEDIKELYESWSSEFRKKGSGRGEQRHVTHMIFSADVEQIQKNANKVLDSVRETLWDEFGSQGYEYNFVLHTDTNQPHVHCILKNYNSLTKRKIRLDKHDFLRIRSSFAEQMNKRNLKRHIATLRRDRPEILQQVKDTISKLQENANKMSEVLDTCAFSNNKTQLNAQLTKQEDTKHRFKDADIEFNYDKGFLELRVDKIGSPFEATLKQISIQVLGSKKFGVSSDKNASVIVRDFPKLTIEQEKIIKLRFNKLMRKKDFLQTKKEVNRISKGSKDVLPQYTSILKNIDFTIKRIKKSKLSYLQRTEQTQQLKDLREKILNGCDVEKIQKASILKNNEEYLKVANELNQETLKTPSAKDINLRKRGIEKWKKTHENQLKDRIKFFRERNDSKTVELLKGMRSAKTYQEIVKQQFKVKKEIVKNQKL